MLSPRIVLPVLALADAAIVFSLVATNGDPWVSLAGLFAHLLFSVLGALVIKGNIPRAERWMGATLAAAFPIIGAALWTLSRPRASLVVDVDDGFGFVAGAIGKVVPPSPPRGQELLTFDGLFSSDGEKRRRVLEALVEVNRGDPEGEVAALLWARSRASGQLLLEIGAVLGEISQRRSK